MSDPYETLGLKPGADEGAIRASYLALVRRFPPEREPERFAEIRTAYERLSNPTARVERQLFDVQAHDSLEAILAEARSRLRQRRISTEVLLSLVTPS